MASIMKDVCGNSLTCSSPEALKLYNQALGHFVSTRSIFLKPLQRAIELESGFTMARCLMGTIMCDPFVRDSATNAEYLDILNHAYPNALDREKRHIEAFKAQIEGNVPKSSELYDQITIKYPRDLQAVRLAFGDYLTIGDFEKMRNMMSRAVIHCPKDFVLYPYVLSLYAFSLEETNERQYAEELCRESLTLQPVNPWASHTMAHVIEEVYKAEKGVDHLISTRQHWSSCLLSHHITWHLTLFYFDLNQTDKILKEFDQVMAPNMKPGNMFQLLDASSLLWRLNVMGIDPGESRWKLVTEAFQVQVGNPSHSWLETHLMMSLCYGKVTADTARLALANQVIQSMEVYSKESTSSDCSVADLLGVPVCNALLAYGQEKYDEVLSLMLPLRYDFIKFGGSWAQRQVFELTIIMAAIKANDLSQALALIIELKSKKPNSKVLQRLYNKISSKVAAKN
ncbi:PREDICTED: tetratricopeptide repeat protein 38-like [Amphimedon queenslandica]|uniref:Tetratricopeptide repeat protein 38 n=1 Tax=Amphimedon queenslandica TaxID=400682 RepID=A0A1X7VDS2_AMPQE|nr:PREDICTED: tetratricopeptide repeat protein 38-like [Amphimedon queenslandica]|eukprot:XP_011410522.1 PREDICTED: tetratricopeptide repeat protein 38-like [Amphimedon queenslandica]